jgi:hypothetical protein
MGAKFFPAVLFRLKLRRAHSWRVHVLNFILMLGATANTQISVPEAGRFVARTFVA